MSIRIPTEAPQNMRSALLDIEQEIEDLKAKLAALQDSLNTATTSLEENIATTVAEATETGQLRHRDLIELDSDDHTQYVLNTGDTITGDVEITKSDSNPADALAIVNTNADAEGSGIRFKKLSASPAANDYLGHLRWAGYDSANNVQNYIRMSGRVTDTTDGSEDAYLEVAVATAGAVAQQFVIGNGYCTTVNNHYFGNDTAYAAYLSSSNPFLQFDTNDYLTYDRSNNEFGFYINSTKVLGVKSGTLPLLVENHGGTIVDPNGITATINIITWIAPYACTVTAVKGYRVGGSGASINARKNGSDNHLSSALSLTSADTWTDGGSVQNTSYSAGDKLEIMLTSVSGSPTQVAVSVYFARA